MFLAQCPPMMDTYTNRFFVSWPIIVVASLDFVHLVRHMRLSPLAPSQFFLFAAVVFFLFPIFHPIYGILSNPLHLGSPAQMWHSVATSPVSSWEERRVGKGVSAEA